MLKYEKEKEKAAFKDMSFKKKCEHIWEYYRLEIIWGTIGLLFIAWILNHYIINPPKDPSLNITFHSYEVDTHSLDPLEEQLREAFPEMYTSDTEIQLYTNSSGLDDQDTEYASVMKMMALMASESIDIVIGDYDEMAYDAYNSYLMPLDDVFTEEEMRQLEELAYVQEGAESGICSIRPGDIDTDGNEYLMEERPYFVDVSGNLTLRTIISGEATYIGISSNAVHLEEAKEVLWYLLTAE